MRYFVHRPPKSTPLFYQNTMEDPQHPTPALRNPDQKPTGADKTQQQCWLFHAQKPSNERKPWHSNPSTRNTSVAAKAAAHTAAKFENASSRTEVPDEADPESLKSNQADHPYRNCRWPRRKQDPEVAFQTTWNSELGAEYPDVVSLMPRIGKKTRKVSCASLSFKGRVRDNWYAI